MNICEVLLVRILILRCIASKLIFQIVEYFIREGIAYSYIPVRLRDDHSLMGNEQMYNR